MKKKLAGILSAILATTLISGCGAPAAAPASSGQAEATSTASTSTDESAPAKTQRIIGFSPTTMNNPFFQWIEKNAREAVEANGDKMITVDPQMDPQKQISQVEDLLTQNIDVLIMAPFDSASIKNALVAASDKKVPVIIFDNPVLDPQYVASTVASDNYKAGQEVGKDMLTRLEKGSEIALIYSPMGETDRLRLSGFTDAVGDTFKIVAELDGKGDTGVTLPVAEDVLQGNPNVKAFFCCNDPSAIGAAQAIAAAGKTGTIMVYGIDGSPEAKAAIKAGDMTGTGAQSPTNIAKLAVQAAYDVMDGKTVESKIAVDTFIINPENVDDYGVDGWQ